MIVSVFFFSQWLLLILSPCKMLKTMYCLGVEEEKKSDDQDTNVPTQPSPEKPQQQQQQQAATPSVSSDEAGKDPTTTKDSAPVGLAGQSFRCLFLDLPMLLVLSLYAGMQLADYAKEEFFSAQYEGLIWDVARQKEEIT